MAKCSASPSRLMFGETGQALVGIFRRGVDIFVLSASAIAGSAAPAVIAEPPPLLTSDLFLIERTVTVIGKKSRVTADVAKMNLSSASLPMTTSLPVAVSTCWRVGGEVPEMYRGEARGTEKCVRSGQQHRIVLS